MVQARGTGSERHRFATYAVIGLLLVATLASAGPAHAASRRGRYAIGDSVMLGAADELRARGIHVNATVSRQFSALPSLMRSLRRSGDLRKKVIVHLGNNGYLELRDCKRAVRAAGNRHVYLVTLKVPRGWRQTNNRRLHRCASALPNASIVDWFTHSVNHPGWFADDLYHLSRLDRRRYAGYIAHQTG